MGFDVKKSGECRVGLIGFPSVGKSTLLTVLTGTESAAAAYEFTTLTCLSEDHQILTNQGFQYLHELEKNTTPNLLIAGYDNDTQQLVYESPSRLVIHPVKETNPEQPMVEIQQYTTASTVVDSLSASSSHPLPVSLKVTPDHDLLVRFGRIMDTPIECSSETAEAMSLVIDENIIWDGVWESKEDEHTEKNKDGIQLSTPDNDDTEMGLEETEKTFNIKNMHRVPYDYRKVAANALLGSGMDKRDVIQMLSIPSGGVNGNTDENTVNQKLRTFFTTEQESSAFLFFYGIVKSSNLSVEQSMDTIVLDYSMVDDKHKKLVPLLTQALDTLHQPYTINDVARSIVLTSPIMLKVLKEFIPTGSPLPCLSVSATVDTPNTLSPSQLPWVRDTVSLTSDSENDDPSNDNQSTVSQNSDAIILNEPVILSQSLNPWVFNLSKTNARSVLQGIHAILRPVSSDSLFSKLLSHLVFETSSVPLCNDITQLAIHADYVPSYTYSNDSLLYRITLSDASIDKAPIIQTTQKTHTVMYTGRTWCVAMPHGYIVTRRIITDSEHQSTTATVPVIMGNCIPGTINYKGAKIQLLDLPGIIEGAKDGKGRGRQVIGTARTCNLILIVLDASKPMTHKRIIERELEGFGIRLNKKFPNIYFNRKEKGGVGYRSMVTQSKLDEDTVRAICTEYKIHNADITIRQPNCTVDDFIDVIEGNRVYIPCLYVMNKIDSITIEELDLLDKVPHYVMISARDGWGLDDLLEKMWDYLGMVRIYTKPRGQIPDYNAPVILQSETRKVEEFCNRIHKGILKTFSYAWVWGASVKHQPQRVGKDHVLEDEDVIQIVKK